MVRIHGLNMFTCCKGPYLSQTLLDSDLEIDKDIEYNLFTAGMLISGH